MKNLAILVLVVHGVGHVMTGAGFRVYLLVLGMRCGQDNDAAASRTLRAFSSKCTHHPRVIATYCLASAEGHRLLCHGGRLARRRLRCLLRISAPSFQRLRMPYLVPAGVKGRPMSYTDPLEFLKCITLYWTGFRVYHMAGSSTATARPPFSIPNVLSLVLPVLLSTVALWPLHKLCLVSCEVVAGPVSKKGGRAWDVVFDGKPTG